MHKENAAIPPGGQIPTKLKNWLYLATCCLERLLPWLQWEHLKHQQMLFCNFSQKVAF